MRYYDNAGGPHRPGFACPDLISIGAAILVFEIKLTRCSDAYIQLRQLYLPLVQHFWPGRRIGLVQVCKNWAGAPAPTISSVHQIMTYLDRPEINELHLPL